MSVSRFQFIGQKSRINKHASKWLNFMNNSFISQELFSVTVHRTFCDYNPFWYCFWYIGIGNTLVCYQILHFTKWQPTDDELRGFLCLSFVVENLRLSIESWVEIFLLVFYYLRSNRVGIAEATPGVTLADLDLYRDIFHDKIIFSVIMIAGYIFMKTSLDVHPSVSVLVGFPTNLFTDEFVCVCVWYVLNHDIVLLWYVQGT